MKARHSKALALILLSLISILPLQARGKKKPRVRTAPAFAYYLLVLSYAPDFCAQPGGGKDPRECGSGRHVGFVVHGLWPQGESTRGPENCGAASPVPKSLVQTMLQYFPAESLIQHEWKDHGTCSGLSMDEYFAAVRKARDSVTIPEELTPESRQSMTPAQITTRMAAANPGLPAAAFRTSCYSDKELKELRICLNKDLSARACGNSAGQCTAPSVTLLPVR